MSDILSPDLRLHFGEWIIAPTGMAVQVTPQIVADRDVVQPVQQSIIEGDRAADRHQMTAPSAMQKAAGI